MDVTLLGTGSADGWPNPFCRCPSCLAVRGTGELRSQTSALVDGRILLDCGPDTPRQAVRAGADLADVHTVLVTHAHPDHFDPAMLLYRSWATGAPLRVCGPQPVLDACRHWVAPHGSPVVLTPVVAGQELEMHGYRVLVRRARHGPPGEAVLYDVTGPDGGRLLYATDTGPLPAADVAALAGARFDVVLLEETFGDRADLPGDHLNLETFASTVAALRAVDAVHEATDVVAVHLSHHNPPAGALVERLAECGARVVPDLTRLRA